jgi:hypothetical protein
MIVWPERQGQDKFNRWKQESNPMTKTSGGVDGFECLDCWFASNGFGGLEFNTGAQSVLDGTVNHGNWYYAIGSTSEWSGAIPGAAGPEQVVELYARYEPTAIPVEKESYQLLFRQTHPTYLKATQWRQWNTCDAQGDAYSILNSLNDDMRMADGKFHFKMVWPEITDGAVMQEWKQTSNPMARDTNGVEGYEAVDVSYAGGYWQGLEYNTRQENSLLDGSVD